MLRRTTSYLKEYGLSQVSSGCDVSIRYQAFGGFQAELVGGLVKKGYWSQEGSVTISHLGKSIIQDEPIVLRGYDSRQEILDATAWQVVKPVTKAFLAGQQSKP